MPKPVSVKKPSAVRGSRSGRPIMALLDLLGRRWTLRIIWELRDTPLTSRALRTACDDASPTIVQARLSELREAGLVALEPGDGYSLTALGRELEQTFLPLSRFAERWSRRAKGADRLSQGERSARSAG
jgi:DNA-binding HxlR family transcriptional regulator